MIRLTCISNLLSFYTICFWTAFSSILFAFANLREKIWAHDLHCGENSFSMAARYLDWVDEMMGEALWWEIWFIVNKPKRNVELKSVIGEVHCKREKCCASEPFTLDQGFPAHIKSWSYDKYFWIYVYRQRGVCKIPPPASYNPVKHWFAPTCTGLSKWKWTLQSQKNY